MVTCNLVHDTLMGSFTATVLTTKIRVITRIKNIKNVTRCKDSRSVHINGQSHMTH